MSPFRDQLGEQPQSILISRKTIPIHAFPFRADISQKLELGALTMGMPDKETEMDITELTLLMKYQCLNVQSSPSALPPPSPKTWGSLGLRSLGQFYQVWGCGGGVSYSWSQGLRQHSHGLSSSLQNSENIWNSHFSATHTPYPLVVHNPQGKDAAPCKRF